MDLEANTAVTLKIGPFIDETDGKTDETALTITQAEVRLSKNGGDMADEARKVMLLMMNEITNIKKVRHAKSDAAFWAIVLEQSRKWKAFVARVPEEHDLSPSGFARIFAALWEENGPRMPADVLLQMM